MCGCRKGAVQATYNIPENSVWGPILWSILHIAAEKNPAKSNAETLWKRALDSMYNIIPCIECRGHFAEYYAANPYVPVGDVRAYTRTWLCAFHNAVNVRLGKPVFDESGLEAAYGGRTINQYVNQFVVFIPELKRADLISYYKWEMFNTPIMALVK